MPHCYEQQFRVFHFECDPWDRMSPGGALRRMQVIATDHCLSLNLDDSLYQRTHTVFMLSRLSLQMGRMPCVGEEVRVVTRACGIRRAVYHRVTTFYSLTGEELCECDSRWVLVDTDTRRILRKPLEEFLPYFNEDPGDGKHSMDLPEWTDMEEVASLRAGYSLCDGNHHINNASYADLVCDCLPIEQMEQLPKKLLLLYRHEIPMGTDFRMQRAATDKGYYLVADAGTAKCFEASVEF